MNVIKIVYALKCVLSEFPDELTITYKRNKLYIDVLISKIEICADWSFMLLVIYCDETILGYH
jgi:hypothetical protein